MKPQISFPLIVLALFFNIASGSPGERTELSIRNPVSSRSLDAGLAFCRAIPTQCEVINGKPKIKTPSKSVGHSKQKNSKAVASDAAGNGNGNETGSQVQVQVPCDNPSANNDVFLGFDGTTLVCASLNTNNTTDINTNNSPGNSTATDDPTSGANNQTISTPSLQDAAQTQSTDSVGVDGNSNHTYSVTLSQEMVATGLCKPSRYMDNIWERSCPIGSTSGACAAKLEYECSYYKSNTEDLDVKYNASSLKPYENKVHNCMMQMEATFTSNIPNSKGVIDTSLADYVKNASIYMWHALETTPGGTTSGRINANYVTEPPVLDAYLVPQSMTIMGTNSGETSDDNNGMMTVWTKITCPVIETRSDSGWLGFLTGIFGAVLPGVASIAAGAVTAVVEGGLGC